MEDPVAMAVGVTTFFSTDPNASLDPLLTLQTEEEEVSLGAPVREAHPA